MRTATTNDGVRRWFRRYWTFGVGSGAHVLVHGLLTEARDSAERVARSQAPSVDTLDRWSSTSQA